MVSPHLGRSPVQPGVPVRQHLQVGMVATAHHTRNWDAGADNSVQHLRQQQRQSHSFARLPCFKRPQIVVMTAAHHTRN